MEELVLSCLLGIFVFVILCAAPLYAYCTKRTITFTVKEKGTLTHGYVKDGNGQTQTDFMIYTQDNRSFKNVNTIWYFKWRSAELQTRITVGQTYSATIYGWRIGILNCYPNIVNVK